MKKCSLAHIQIIRIPKARPSPGTLAKVLPSCASSFLRTLILLASVFFSTSSASAGINDGLVGYWTFDGSKLTTATATDSSGNGNNGILTGSPKPTSGKIGQGLRINNSYVRIPRSSSLEPTSQITVCVWTKPDVRGRNQTTFANVISKDRTVPRADPWSSYQLSANDGVSNNYGSSFKLAVNGVFYGVGNGPEMKAGLWYHLCGTFDGTTKSFYYNGGLNASDALSPGTISYGGTPADVYLGVNSSLAEDYKGVVDEVRIYNRALSNSEISQLYKNRQTTISATPPNNALLGYWTFDANDTNWVSMITQDVSTRSKNIGTMLSMTKSINSVIGKIGQALKFTSGTAVNVGSNSALNITSNPYTITAWIYPTSIPGPSQATYHSSIFDRWDHGCSGNGYSFGITNAYTFNAPTELEIQVGCGAGNGLAHGGLGGGATQVLTNNVWQHVAVVVDSGGNVTFYINGIGYASSYGSGGPLLAPSTYGGPGYIGNGPGLGFPFAGNIDDVKVYGRALSAKEVETLYKSRQTVVAVTPKTVATSTATGLARGLVGYWTFDGRDVNWSTLRAIDRSAYGTPATIIGMSATTSPTLGKNGSALSFNGSTSILNSFVKQVTTFTFSTWIKTSLPSQGAGLIWGDFSANATGGPKIGLVSGNFFARAGGTACTSVPVPTDGKWHHFVTSRDAGNNWYIYLDGVKTSCGTGPGSDMYDLRAIGGNAQDSSQKYQGSLDDVRVYDRALSDSEVTQLYSAFGIKIR